MMVSRPLVLPVTKTATENEGMIPLINIVFLLLIFFMVAGQMTWLSQIDSEMPPSGSDKAVDRGRVTLAQDRTGQLFIDGERTTLESLPAQLQAAVDEGAGINISMDKHLTAEQLDALLGLLRAQGIVHVTLFSSPDADL